MDEAAWYEATLPGVRESAERVIPFVADLFSFRSVVDVGAGAHAPWVEAFRDLGYSATAVEHPDTPNLSDTPRIDHDLTLDIEIGVRADLAICLEVGEHLEVEYAVRLVEKLTHAADTVVFGAAIPGQPGPGHVNCQWPDYWAAKFRERGWHTVDTVRWLIWEDRNVDFYYRQNLFVASKLVADSHTIKSVVHPAAYLLAAQGWPLQEHPYPV